MPSPAPILNRQSWVEDSDNKPTPEEKEKCLDEIMHDLTILAITGPYRGVMQVLPEKPAAPDKKLARQMRRQAKKARRAKYRDSWDTFWLLRRAKKEKKRQEEKERRENKNERLKVLEEQALPTWLKQIDKYATDGEKKVSFGTGYVNGYDSPMLDKHDLLYMKNILERYGFSCRRVKKDHSYNGPHYYLKVKW